MRQLIKSKVIHKASFWVNSFRFDVKILNQYFFDDLKNLIRRELLSFIVGECPKDETLNIANS